MKVPMSVRKYSRSETKGPIYLMPSTRTLLASPLERRIRHIEFLRSLAEKADIEDPGHWRRAHIAIKANKLGVPTSKAERRDLEEMEDSNY